MDLTKVEGIKTWPRPSKVKDVHSFLGFCNFYRPFIPSFSKIAKPLNELMCKMSLSYGKTNMNMCSTPYEI